MVSPIQLSILIRIQSQGHGNQKNIVLSLNIYQSGGTFYHVMGNPDLLVIPKSEFSIQNIIFFLKCFQ